jgi:hypothetical protein
VTASTVRPDRLLRGLSFVQIKGDEFTHFYWPYARVTLCGRDKVYGLTSWWVENPCPECSARYIEVRLEEERQVE